MLRAPVVQLILTAVLEPSPDVPDRLGHGAAAQAGGLRALGADAPGSLVARGQPQRQLGPRLHPRPLELLVRDPHELRIAGGLEQRAERRLADRRRAVERA